MGEMVTIEVLVDADLLKQAEEILAEKYGMTVEEVIVLLLKETIRVGGVPFDFEPEWLIDESRPFDAEIIKELKGQGLRGNDFLIALKERRASTCN